MRYDTAGNQIKEIISGCDCGLTGGCPKCRPNLYSWEGKEYNHLIEMLKEIDKVVVPMDSDIPDDIIWRIAKKYSLTLK
jgi:hypothetical protein